MTKLETDIANHCIEGQKYGWVDDKVVDEYHRIIRLITGHIRVVIEAKNPLGAVIVVHENDMLLEVINPALTKEIQWIETAQTLLKAWVNDKISVNRILGITDDNQPS